MSFFWIVLSSIVEKYGSNSVAALIGTIGCVGLLFFIALNKPFDKWLKGLDGEYETETLIFPDHSGRGKHWFDGQVKDGTPWKGVRKVFEYLDETDQSLSDLMEERDPELRTSLNTLKDGDEEEDSENQEISYDTADEDNRDTGLWARLYVENDGDEGKTREAYRRAVDEGDFDERD